ncbi:MAG: hypothetical protein IJR27_03285 [Synergistaceae bacterium]|nr:hypothetical protein [Synergistaceae bacterium]MBQ9574281.1 hypothetical protein [Synergistaceae bacterium]
MDNLSKKVNSLEEDINMVYDSLDERISRLERQNSDRIAMFGITASIIIGVIQIIIALLK